MVNINIDGIYRKRYNKNISFGKNKTPEDNLAKVKGEKNHVQKKVQ